MEAEGGFDFAERLERIAGGKHAGHAPPANRGGGAIHNSVAITAKRRENLAERPILHDELAAPLCGDAPGAGGRGRAWREMRIIGGLLVLLDDDIFADVKAQPPDDMSRRLTVLRRTPARLRARPAKRRADP